MNAHAPFALRTYETVDYRSWSYTMSEDDFPEGCLVQVDVPTGKRFATGRNKLGAMLPAIQLDVPLCKGCDGPIVHHICPDCQLAFLGDEK